MCVFFACVFTFACAHLCIFVRSWCYRRAFVFACVSAVPCVRSVTAVRSSSHAFPHRRAFVISSSGVCLRMRHYIVVPSWCHPLAFVFASSLQPRAFVMSPSPVGLWMRLCIVVRSCCQRCAFLFACVFASTCVRGFIVVRSSSHASLHRSWCHRAAFVFACVSVSSCVSGVTVVCSSSRCGARFTVYIKRRVLC